MDWILFSRAFLCVVFFTSVCFKMIDRQSFKITIEGIGIKKGLVSAAFYFLIVLELAASILLWFEALLILAVSIIYLLSIIFLISTVKIMKTEEAVQCNCFGSLTDEKFGKTTLIRIAAILLANIYLTLSLNSIQSHYLLVETISYITTSLGIIMLYSLLFTYISLRKKINKEIM